MSIYKNAIRDARIREYLPVHRVMLAEQAQNAEILAGQSGDPALHFGFRTSLHSAARRRAVARLRR